jgi:hypothetical protein
VSGLLLFEKRFTGRREDGKVSDPNDLLFPSRLPAFLFNPLGTGFA